MKKKLFLVSLFVMIASCNNDDSSTKKALTFEPNLLLRGWSYETILVDETLYLYEHNFDCYRDYFGFRNNVGQLYQYEETFFTNDYCTNNTTGLRWEPVGNYINFYFGEPKVDTYEVISLNNEQFIYAIDRDLNNDGIKERLIVTAIPYDPYDSFEIQD